MHRSTLAISVLLGTLIGAGCKDPEPAPTQGTDSTDGQTDTDTDTDTDTQTETSDTAASTGTGDTGTTTTGEIFDCATVPAAPLSITTVAGRGYHDVAFDPYGNIIGSDNTSLITSAFDGTWNVFVPGMGIVQGMDWLPNGDLVVASDSTGSLVRVTLAGSYSTLATDSGAYGVIVGPDGMVYTANYQSVQRVDPATGNKETLVQRAGLQPRVLNFSPDYSKLYIGTLFGSGAIYQVDLDENLDPLGTPTVLATGVGSGDYHDALGVDACGNIYVPDYSTNNLYRITPDGQSSLYVNFSFQQYTHGLEWGSGVGGWKDDAIYLPQPYNGNTVVEIHVGVPSRTFSGTVINL